jgi:hypothetical protein
MFSAARFERKGATREPERAEHAMVEHVLGRHCRGLFMSNAIERWIDPHCALALLKPKAGDQLCRGCCLGSGAIAKPKQKPKRNKKRIVVSAMSHSSAVRK